MKNELPKFRYINHTADVGLKIYGANLAELFSNAALGLFDIIANLDRVCPNTERMINVEATDQEALLVSWLSELNYLFFTEQEIYKEFDILNISETEMTSLIKGEKIDDSRHEIYTEVKAVTYHDLYIKQIAQGWEAQVIFDL